MVYFIDGIFHSLLMNTIMINIFSEILWELVYLEGISEDA